MKEAPATQPETSCPACGAAHIAGARFCRECGAGLQVTCPGCGKPVAPSARFCRDCGASIAPAPPAEPAGAARTSGAYPTAPPPATSKRPGSALKWALGAGVLVAIVGGGVGALLLRGDGDDQSDRADDVPSAESTVRELEQLPPGATSDRGLPLRARSLLTHPSGATAEVPGGEVLFGTALDLKQLKDVHPGPAWQGVGSAWTLFSAGGFAPPGGVVVSLPAGDLGDDAELLVLSASGSWIPVASRLEGGQLVATFEDVPSGWVATVARRLVPAQEDVSEALIAERLYWTDREAWVASETGWLTSQDFSVSRLDSPAMVSREASGLAAATFTEWRKDLDWVVRTLGATRIGVDPQMLPGVREDEGLPGVGVSATVAVAQYKAAIVRLASVRNDWTSNRKQWAEQFGYGEDYSRLAWDENLSLDQALETLLYEFAPWGIDVTSYLARSGVLDTMDLRVLRPYGDLLFTDVKFAPGVVPFVDEELEAVETDATGRAEVRYLRLYSERTMREGRVLDYLKDWKTEAFVRYLPVALWSLGVISGGPVLLTVTAADQAINWWQSAYQQDDPYMYTKLETTGAAIGIADSVIEIAATGIRSTGSGWTELAAGTTAFGAAQILYSGALAYAVSNTDWYMTKDLRQVTAGSQSYCVSGDCNWPWPSVAVPPIQMIAGVRGNVSQPNSLYPSVRTKLMAWSMALWGFGDVRPDLHQWFVDGRPESTAMRLSTAVPKNPKEALTGLGWEPYRRDAWPDKSASLEPQAQAIRFPIPKSFVELVESQYGVEIGSPLEDYGLVIELEGSDGSRSAFSVKEAAERLPTDAKDTFYASVVLLVDGQPEVEGLDPGYAGPQEEVDGRRLRTNWTAHLKAFDQEEKDWLTYTVAFPDGKRLKPLDPEEPGSARVHYADAVPDETGELIFKFTSFNATGDLRVVQHLLGAFAKPTPWPAAACVADPTNCYLAVVTMAAPAAPGSSASAAWICTEAGLDALLPITPDSAAAVFLSGTCSNIAGPVRPEERGVPATYSTLTPTSLKAATGGTYRAGAGSQPNVMTWIVTDAKFAGQKVTGTLSMTDYAQFKDDGVWTPDYNEKGPLPLNPPIFATVTFEGVRVK